LDAPVNKEKTEEKAGMRDIEGQAVGRSSRIPSVRGLTIYADGNRKRAVEEILWSRVKSYKYALGPHATSLAFTLT
jgi:hypothetical protein